MWGHRVHSFSFDLSVPLTVTHQPLPSTWHTHAHTHRHRELKVYHLSGPFFCPLQSQVYNWLCGNRPLASSLMWNREHRCNVRQRWESEDSGGPCCSSIPAVFPRCPRGVPAVSLPSPVGGCDCVSSAGSGPEVFHVLLSAETISSFLELICRLTIKK